MVNELKLFDDSMYEEQQKKIVVPFELTKKISDVAQTTHTQLCLDFLSDCHHSPALQSTDFDDLPSKISGETLMTKISQVSNDIYFDSMTQLMQKHGFNELSFFNRFFKKFLFQVRNKMPLQFMMDKSVDSFSYAESWQIVEVLKESFALCNNKNHLPFPFRGVHFDHMRRIYINQFYSLFMPQEKVYYANRKAGGILFDKKKYKEALPSYRRVLEIHPDDLFVQKRVDFITARVK